MKYDIYGIGSPLIDLMIKADDKLIEDLGLKKGGMHLFSDEQMKEAISILENEIIKITPGDSTANTVAGISNFGGKTAYLGKAGNDEHGKLFVTSLLESQVDSKVVLNNSLTGKVIALITPDSERTMIVYLGAAKELDPEDVNEEDIKDSHFLHLTAYQLEEPRLKEAAITAMKIAKANNVKISIDLADAGVVKRNLDFLKEIIKEYAHIVFANEEEAIAFTDKEPREALDYIAELSKISVVKVGKCGSFIKANGQVYEIPCDVAEPVDTTGAGDMYAAGVLFGLARGHSHEKSGRIGSYAAAKIVSQIGARFDQSIREEIENKVINS